MDLVDRIERARAHLGELERALPSPGGASAEALATLGRDLDDLRAAALELDTTSSLLRMVVEARDSDDMLRRASRFVRDRLGVDAVGIRLREGEDYPYFVTCGFPPRFVAAESSLVPVDRLGRPLYDPDGRVALECLCGAVLRGRLDPTRSFTTPRGSFWTNSTSALLAETTSEERGGPTRNHCHGAGYESVALVPLSAGAEVLGLIQLNDRLPGRFTPDRIHLVEELAGVLAAALD